MAISGAVIRAIAAVGPLGAAMLIGPLYGRMMANQVRRPLDESEQPLLAMNMRLTAATSMGLRAIGTEYKALSASLDQVRDVTAAHPLPPIPLTVITASGPPKTPNEEAARKTITELHAALVAGNPLGRQVFAAESGHLVPVDQPDLVAQCVRETVKAGSAKAWA